MFESHESSPQIAGAEMYSRTGARRDERELAASPIESKRSDEQFNTQPARGASGAGAAGGVVSRGEKERGREDPYNARETSPQERSVISKQGSSSKKNLPPLEQESLKSKKTLGELKTKGTTDKKGTFETKTILK